MKINCNYLFGVILVLFFSCRTRLDYSLENNEIVKKIYLQQKKFLKSQKVWNKYSKNNLEMRMKFLDSIFINQKLSKIDSFILLETLDPLLFYSGSYYSSSKEVYYTTGQMNKVEYNSTSFFDINEIKKVDKYTQSELDSISVNYSDINSNYIYITKYNKGSIEIKRIIDSYVEKQE